MQRSKTIDVVSLIDVSSENIKALQIDIQTKFSSISDKT